MMTFSPVRGHRERATFERTREKMQRNREIVRDSLIRLGKDYENPLSSKKRTKKRITFHSTNLIELVWRGEWINLELLFSGMKFETELFFQYSTCYGGIFVEYM